MAFYKYFYILFVLSYFFSKYEYILTISLFEWNLEKNNTEKTVINIVSTLLLIMAIFITAILVL